MGEVWSIQATEEACDIAMRAPGAGRVATDEVFLAGRLPPDLRAAILTVDPAAVIREASHGWEEIALLGSDARDILPQLSELAVPDPPGYVQGDVARVPARVFAHDHGVSLFVRAPVAHHVRRRVDEVRGRG